jgi:hypothetical protein
MAGVLSNIKVEPCVAIFDGSDLGFTDGDIEVSMEEQGTEITAHQEGTNVLDMIRTGKMVELSLTLKETTVAKVAALLAHGGGTSTGVAAQTTVDTVADVSGSLNNKVFFIYGASGVGYCFYMNVNSAGTDPSIPGFTSVAVPVATDATADAVADAIATAADALSDFTAANPGADVVTIVNAATGVRTAPDAGNSGFTIAVTVAGVSTLTGWGSSKDFTGMLADSKKLYLRPVVNVASAVATGDLAFWKAYPMVGSIVQSGENPKLVTVSFKIFPDLDKAAAIRLFVLGDHIS